MISIFNNTRELIEINVKKTIYFNSDGILPLDLKFKMKVGNCLLCCDKEVATEILKSLLLSCITYFVLQLSSVVLPSVPEKLGRLIEDCTKGFCSIIEILLGFNRKTST